MGVFIGVEIPENVFGEGLIIHHNGSIGVNGSSRVGKNCQLHGDNCIGNVGKSDSLTDCPQIGCWGKGVRWNHYCRQYKNRCKCGSDEVF